MEALGVMVSVAGSREEISAPRRFFVDVAKYLCGCTQNVLILGANRGNNMVLSGYVVLPFPNFCFVRFAFPSLNILHVFALPP